MKGLSIENVDKLREFFRDGAIRDLYDAGLRDIDVHPLCKLLETEWGRIRDTDPDEQMGEMIKLLRQAQGRLDHDRG